MTEEIGSSAVLRLAPAPAADAKRPVAAGRRRLRRRLALLLLGYLIRQQGQVQYGGLNWTPTVQGVSANYPPITTAVNLYLTPVGGAPP